MTQTPEWRTDLHARTKKDVDDLFQALRRKLDPWSLGFWEGRRFEIQLFDGRKIAYEGVGFEGNPRECFWGGYIEPFLEQGVLMVFETTIKRCKDARLQADAYLNEAAELLRRLTRGVYVHMADIDRRLRGRGEPESVLLRDTTNIVDRMTRYIDGQLKGALLLAAQRPEPTEPLAPQAWVDEQIHRAKSLPIVKYVLFACIIVIGVATLVGSFDVIWNYVGSFFL